jgi:Kef-type K+ transport system membrane component KefB
MSTRAPARGSRMPDYFFLPDWPIRPGALGWIAAMLLAAVVAGELGERLLRLPRVVGYVAAGVVLGPQVLGLVDASALRSLNVFLDFAIGLVLFDLGRRVDPGWLVRNPWLAATSVAESLLAFVAVLAVLRVLGVSRSAALATAAIAAATSPAVVITVARELGARGQVTERLLLLTALDSVYAFVAVAMLYAWLHLEYRHSISAVLLHPAYLLLGSLVLAAAAAGLLHLARWRLAPGSAAESVVTLATIAAAVAVADALDLPVVLALLALGVITRTFASGRGLAAPALGAVETLAIVALFALTGAMLEATFAPAALAAALAIIVARGLGKSIGVLAFARPSGLGLRKGALVAIGLTPMSALALVMAQRTVSVYPDLATELKGTLLAAVALLEVIGPVAARFALARAGEWKGAAPRGAGRPLAPEAAP